MPPVSNFTHSPSAGSSSNTPQIHDKLDPTSQLSSLFTQTITILTEFNAQAKQQNLKPSLLCCSSPTDEVPAHIFSILKLLKNNPTIHNFDEQILSSYCNSQSTAKPVKDALDSFINHFKTINAAPLENSNATKESKSEDLQDPLNTASSNPTTHNPSKFLEGTSCNTCTRSCEEIINTSFLGEQKAQTSELIAEVKDLGDKIQELKSEVAILREELKHPSIRSFDILQSGLNSNLDAPRHQNWVRQQNALPFGQNPEDYSFSDRGCIPTSHQQNYARQQQYTSITNQRPSGLPNTDFFSPTEDPNQSIYNAQPAESFFPHFQQDAPNQRNIFQSVHRMAALNHARTLDF